MEMSKLVSLFVRFSLCVRFILYFCMYVRLILLPNKPWFLRVCSTRLFENTLGKGEIARNEQFLLFPTVFSTRLENLPPYSSNLKLSPVNSFSLEVSQICRLGKG